MDDLLAFRRTTIIALTAVFSAMTAIAGDSDFLARLRTADDLERRGEYAAAERILSDLLKAAGRSGADDPQKAVVLNNLGSVHQFLANYSKAEACFRSAIEIQTRVYGATDTGTIRSKLNLATLYIQTDQPSKVERLGLRALLDRLPPNPNGSAERARLLSALGGTERLRGRYEQAIRCNLESLAEWARVEPDGISMMEVLNNLGAAYTESGRYAEALPYWDRALGIAERRLSRQHPSLVTLLANIGSGHFHAKRFEEAELYYQRAVTLGEQVLGREHTLVAKVLLSYSVVLEQTNRKVQAREYRHRAIATLEAAARADGSDHTVEFAELQRRAARAR